MNNLRLLDKLAASPRVACSDLLGVTVISTDASIKTSRPKCRPEYRGLSLRHPTIHSPTLGVSVAKMAPEDCVRLREHAPAPQHRQELKYQILLRRCHLLCIGLKPIRHLRQSSNLLFVRAAVRMPLLELLLPSIRNRAMW